ncbi:MAG: PorP/SprF family type IX secretion system membrane protein [Cryomorphaceae bacterium]
MQRILFILAFSVIASGAVAQMGLDPEFSTYYRHTLNTNPALAGQADTKWQVQTTVREQYWVVSQPYRSGQFSFDINLPINAWSGNIWGAGISVIYDDQGDTRLRTNGIAFDLAVGQYLDPREQHSLSVGFQGGLVQRSIAYTDVYWNNQWVTDGFNLRRSSGETLPGEAQSYLDISTGFQYSYDGDLVDMTAGYAAFHANRPDASLYIDSADYGLPVRHTLHWTMEHRIKKDNMMSLNPSLLITRQGKTNNIIFGNDFVFYFNEPTRVTGKRKEYSMSLGVHHRLAKDMIGTIMLNLAGFTFGGAYDISINNINRINGYMGAWEVYIGYRAGFRKGSNSRYMPNRKGKL